MVYICHPGTGRQRQEGLLGSLSPHQDLGDWNGYGELLFTQMPFTGVSGHKMNHAHYKLLENVEKFKKLNSLSLTDSRLPSSPFYV